MTDNSKSKLYVLDTNVLLSDANALESFQENNLLIPIAVLEELDNHKSNQDDVGRNARETIRKISAVLKDVVELKHGVSLGENKGLLFFTKASRDTLPAPEFSENTPDNQILLVCSELLWNKRDFVLITKDVSLRIKAKSLGIPSEDYKKGDIASSINTLYKGVRTIRGEFDLDEFYASGFGINLPGEVVETLHSNEFLILEDSRAEGKSAICRFTKKGSPLKKIKEHAPSKIQARNKEQKFALDLLMDPDILLVSLSGIAGCGKSLISLAAGLSQVLDHKRYESLVICRPMEPLGREMGYLPGMIEEKIEPWMAPIKDNLKKLLGDNKKKKGGQENSFSTFDYLVERGIIEIQPMTYIRGRSISNAFILIDEAQNISPHEIKTIITRAGEGTKIVLNGDVEQIDAQHLDSVSNGLSVVIERFKNIDLAGHITLHKGERSELATVAASVL